MRARPSSRPGICCCAAKRPYAKRSVAPKFRFQPRPWCLSEKHPIGIDRDAVVCEGKKGQIRVGIGVRENDWLIGMLGKDLAHCIQFGNTTKVRALQIARQSSVLPRNMRTNRLVEAQKSGDQRGIEI